MREHQRLGFVDRVTIDGIPLELDPPPAEEREWLLDGLAQLLKRQGFLHFVAAPILKPTNEDFPDHLPPGPRGVRVLLRRLLAYAGLAEHRVKLQVFEERSFSEFDRHGIGHAGPGAAAWFAGIRGDVCEFGVNAKELRNTEELIGILGHEVAHAFRHHHGLAAKDPDIEERLTDLTTVYLGFGVFLLNASLSFKTGGWSESGERLLYEKQARGYLSPRHIAFLLATQAVARGFDREKRLEVARPLAPNHQKLFEDACELLDSPPELRARLGVPEPSEWGALPARREPLSDLETADEAIDRAPETPVHPAAGAVRVRHTLAGMLAVLGAVLPFFVGFFGLLEGWTLLGTAAVACALGAVLGARLESYTCSACRGRLPRTAARCPSCNALISETAAPDGGDPPAETERDEVEELAPEVRLISGMYAAWAIERGFVTEPAEEQFAELVVAVRCGNYPLQQLAEAWPELLNHLTEAATDFIDHYHGGGKRLMDEDFARLTTGVVLSESQASYRRVADVLDARFEAWSNGEAET